jgi:transcriptional regulator with XRE-family HTH domain
MRSSKGAGTHIGAHIRAARLRLGWSQTELAHKLSVSQPTVAHWESGAHAPRWALLPRIAALLDLRREELTARPCGDIALEGGDVSGLIRHIPVFEWPRSGGEVDMLVSGKALPVSYVSLASPGEAPVAIILEDPEAAEEFPPGSIGLLDLSDRAPREGSWYLFVVDGAPVTRIWRSKPQQSAPPSAWDAPALRENAKDAPVGRIVLSIRPH